MTPGASGLQDGQAPDTEGIGFHLPAYDKAYRVRRTRSGTDSPDEEPATVIEARWLLTDLTAALALVDAEPQLTV